jgi:hypothetical protein
MTGQKPTVSVSPAPCLIAKPGEPGVQMVGCCQETGFKSATAVTRSPSEIL